MKKKGDLLVAPLGQGGLLLLVAAISWAAHQPFLFASLGPTIYELIEQPKRNSARPCKVVRHFPVHWGRLFQPVGAARVEQPQGR